MSHEPHHDEPTVLSGSLSGISLSRQVWLLALWPLLENILAFFVGMNDQLIAGRLATGSAQIAIVDAMGLIGYVTWFFNILQAALAMGVMALVSRSVGAKDKHTANLGLGQGVWLGAIGGLISGIVVFFGRGTLVDVMKISPEAGEHVRSFLAILAFSGPVSGAMFCIMGALRGAGDTRTPFFAMLGVNIVNVIFSIMLAFPFGMKVAGIATGTVIGWCCGLIFLVAILAKKHRSIALSWQRAALRWHTATVRRILRVAAPQSFEILLMWLIQAYGVFIIAHIGIEGALGAHMMGVRMESMSFLPGFALGTASAALAGQYLGAQRPDLAKKAVQFTWKIAAITMGTLGLSLLLGRDLLIQWMAPDNAALAHLARPLVNISAFTQPFFATCIVLKMSMRGAGASSIVMRWGFGSMIFFRVVLLTILHHHHTINLPTVWILFGADTLTQALVFARLYHRGHWLQAKV